MKCIDCNVDGVKLNVNGQALCTKCERKRKCSVSDDSVKQNVNNLLHYVCHFYPTSTIDGIKKIVSEFYCAREISAAKLLLWNNYSDNLPTFEGRRSTNTRSSQDAEITDILNALKIIDGSDCEFPSFCSDDWERVSRHGPEEFDTLSLLDRVSNLERQLKSTYNTVALHADSIRTLFDINTANDNSYSRRVSSVQKDTVQPQTSQTMKSEGEVQVKLPQSQRLQQHKKDTLRNRTVFSISPERPAAKVGFWDSVLETADHPTEKTADIQQTARVDDSDGFQLSREELRKKSRKQRQQAVYGKAARGSIRGAPLRTDVFVFRLDPSTEIEALKAYVENSSVNVNDIECRSGDTAMYKSFRLNIDSKDTETVMSAEFWPTGVGCRKYFHKRKGPVVTGKVPSSTKDVKADTDNSSNG